jgi:phytoene synthase
LSDLVVDASRLSIRQGSKSFAAAARLFDPSVREDAYMLYAWCRHCDDQIDGQVLGHGAVGIDPRFAAAKLAELEDKTRRALAGQSLGRGEEDQAFAAFQRVVMRHALPGRLPLELLEGFRMDVEGRTYQTLDDVLLYAYRVAGVVGEMMARVMGATDAEILRRAVDLGLALQLTNIARDVVQDARGGRVYLPADWLGGLAGAPAKVADPANRDAVFQATSRLISAAEPYYQSARWGLSALGFRSAWAVAAAAGVYRQIGRRVLKGGPGGLEQRAATSRADKILKMLAGGAVAARAVTLDRLGPAPERPPLWSACEAAMASCQI